MTNETFVNYESFGAVGDGKTDDFDAIAAAHAYANEHCLPVRGNPDAVYYIGAKFTRAIPVETDVDFAGARFIVDDSVENAFEFRSLPLFLIQRRESLVLEGEELAAKIGDAKIAREDRAFPWIVPLLSGDSFIRVTNDEHRDFVRFGSNQNKGNPRQDVFLVRADGSLDPSTVPAFTFDRITRLEIFPDREETITVKNGRFESICCRAGKETEYKNVYRSFQRGFRVERSDVVIENMTHRMIDEPDMVLDSGKDDLTPMFGERNESYPYQGFIVGMLCNRLTIRDCLLTGHTTYYEDKPATVSTGGKVPNPVPMGTYDYYFHYCNAVSLIGVKQDVSTGLADARYWGIMASNNCKNFLLDGCEVNRFDAHRGFWNAVLRDCTIGHSINITGGGHLVLENVTKLTGSAFLNVRGDYGGSFEGDIVVRNCRHRALTPYNTNRGQTQTDTRMPIGYLIAHGGSATELFYNWDFGYELFLPTEITVENFVSEAAEECYVYTDQGNIRFENDCRHQHRLTEKITFIGMEPIPTVKKEECTLLKAIPVTVV